MIGFRMYRLAVFFVMLEKKISPQSYEVLIDGKSYDADYIGLNFASGPCCGGNMIPLPMARSDDGYMHIIMFKGKVNLRSLVALSYVMKGEYRKRPNYFQYVKAKELTLSSDTPMHLTADGELYYDSEVKAKIIPKAVKIVAPDGLVYARKDVNNAQE